MKSIKPSSASGSCDFDVSDEAQLDAVGALIVANKPVVTKKRPFTKNLRNPADKAAILKRLRRVRPNSVRRWGRMSAHGMICHLSDAFRVALGEKIASPAGGVLHRTILKLLVLSLPTPLPKNVPTRPEVDQEVGGTRPIHFDLDRRELERLIERFTEEARDFERAAHPIFGRMTEREWARWGYLHMDHHLRQFSA